MGYDRNELIGIGERFHTDSILEWSGLIGQAARQDLPRLKQRGIAEKLLAEIEDARQEVTKLNVAQEGEKKDLSTLVVSRRAALQTGLDWREEVKGLAEAVFDSDPAALARFRTGVKVSQSLPKLLMEVGILLGAVREHLPAFKGVGADETLLKRGQAAYQALDEAQRKLGEEKSQTPAKTAELFHAQGVLYTRTRFVVRIAQVEFRKEEALLGRYAYASLRRQEAAAAGRKTRQTAKRPATTPSA